MSSLINKFISLFDSTIKKALTIWRRLLNDINFQGNNIHLDEKKDLNFVHHGNKGFIYSNGVFIIVNQSFITNPVIYIIYMYYYESDKLLNLLEW